MDPGQMLFAEIMDTSFAELLCIRLGCLAIRSWPVRIEGSIVGFALVMRLAMRQPCPLGIAGGAPRGWTTF